MKIKPMCPKPPQKKTDFYHEVREDAVAVAGQDVRDWILAAWSSNSATASGCKWASDRHMMSIGVHEAESTGAVRVGAG